MVFFSPWRPLLKGWLWSFLGWGGVAVIMAAHGVMTHGDPWMVHWVRGLRDWMPWAVFTPLIFRLVDRVPLDRAKWKFSVPVHVASWVAVIALGHAWRMNFEEPGRRDRPGPPPPREQRPPPPPPGGPFHQPPPESASPSAPPRPPLPGGFDPLRFFSFDLPIYAMLLAGGHALLFFRRDQERAASLARARLESLRMQLQPHFLFNTLNTIAGFVHEDPDKADDLLVTLSELLRMSLETSNAQETALANEIEFVRRYLTIMQARFGERLKFEFEVEHETQRASVPPMLLLPLVENVVEQGLHSRPAGTVLRLSARRSGGMLEIAISNEETGAATESVADADLRLDQTRIRLHELYGLNAGLIVTGGRTLKATLPFRSPSL